MTVRLLTGATGLVGGAIALELLDRTSDDVRGLVRGDDAQERWQAALIGMARGYGRPDLVGEITTRTRAIRGDITEPGCGVASLPRIDEVWHCAASLRYEDEHRTEIALCNVEGTRNVLELARRAGATAFNHVSTAYVAGSNEGLILEAPAADLSAVNNGYERSKILAERLVQDAAGGLRVRIMRPSIVIGHSVTYHGVNWSGMYGLARSLLKFRACSERKLGTFLSHARIRLLADPDIEGNTIPVDFVARNAVTIGLSDSPHMFFHLTNASATTVREGVDVMMELVGLRSPLWVRDRDGFTSLDAALDAGMNFYRSYMNHSKRFDRSHTDAVCGPEASAAPLSSAELARYLAHFLRTERGFDSVARTPARVLHALPS